MWRTKPGGDPFNPVWSSFTCGKDRRGRGFERHDFGTRSAGSERARHTHQHSGGAHTAAERGQILADNQPMLAFVRHLGFTIHRMQDDPEVMEAKLAL